MTVDEAWTIRRVLSWAADDLRSRGNETPRLDAELLLCHVLSANRIGLLTDAERPLSKPELGRYRELHKRRRAGEPVAYLLGVREFYGRSFRVDRRVLVPRPDTETLIEVALARTESRSLQASVVDLCTGSGCVAITLACERPTWRVLGTDISNDALEVARDNALRLGAVPRAWFLRSDLFADLGTPRQSIDLITANPPYIADSEREELPITVRDYEPAIALFAGQDALALVRAILEHAPGYLADDGVLAVEVGAGQAPAVVGMLEQRGFRDVQSRRDLGGIERVVSGRIAR